MNSKMHIIGEYQIWRLSNIKMIDKSKQGWCRQYKNKVKRLYPITLDYSLGGYYHRESWNVHPMKVISKLFQVEAWWWRILYLSLYSKKVLFDYSLGGYSHRESWARTRRCLLASTRAWEVKKYAVEHYYSHREQVFYGCITRIFLVKIWLRYEILELHYRNETRMPWFIMKVRPWNPSCVA
jgi:hypothetical protein